MKNGKNLPISHAYKDQRNQELLPGVPIIEICGRERVLIENHKGIIGYSDSEIRIKVRFGCICIYGSHLRLSKMSNIKLVVNGIICNVSLRGREDRDTD